MRNSMRAIKERQDQILTYINNKKTADVAELSDVFHVSSVTIRRDLDIMADNGLIIRTYGGADRLGSVSLSLPAETAGTDQKDLSAGSIPAAPETVLRRKIAKAASSLLSSNDIVLINSSTTASYTIEYITEDNITVVSNNTRILEREKPQNVTLIMTGGQTTPGYTSLTGAFAMESLSKTVANVCILGVRGISAADGITSSLLEESYVNQKMISQTEGTVIIVADSSKLGKKDRFFSGSADQISVLITDKGADPKEISAFEKKGIQVIIA